MLYGFIYPMVISSGGIDAWNDCQNLVPGAWLSEHMLRAAQSVETMRERDFFLDGSLAMDHIQSETRFLAGDAGMVPVGTWFYAEMESAWPPGLVAEFMLPPPFENGQGDKSALMVAIEPFIIPSKAKNKDHGVNYFRYITSKDKALQFVEEKGTLMAIKGLEEAIEAALAEQLTPGAARCSRARRRAADRRSRAGPDARVGRPDRRPAARRPGSRRGLA